MLGFFFAVGVDGISILSFFLSSVTTSRRDDWEHLTLSPAASPYSGGACCTLLIEGQFSFSHPGSYDMIHWCIQPISSRIWESIGWIVTVMTSSSSTHFLLFLRSCVRKRLHFSGPWHVTLFNGKGLRCLMFMMRSTKRRICWVTEYYFGILALGCHLSFHCYCNYASACHHGFEVRTINSSSWFMAEGGSALQNKSNMKMKRIDA